MLRGLSNGGMPNLIATPCSAGEIMCRKKEVAPAENDAHSTDLFTHRSENDKSDGRKEGAVGKTKSERLDTMDLSLPGYIWILT